MPIRTVQTKYSYNTKYWQGCGETGPFIYCQQECEVYKQPLWKIVWHFLKRKLYIHLLYNPATMLLGIQCREINTYIQMNSVHYCSQQLYLQFLKSETTKMSFQKDNLLKMWQNHNIEYYSAMKSNELLIRATQAALKGVMQSEKDQSQEITYDIIPFL